MTKLKKVEEAAALPRTAAQRKQAERDRKRALGFKLAHLWIHPDDYEALRAYAERKCAAR